MLRNLAPAGDFRLGLASLALGCAMSLPASAQMLPGTQEVPAFLPDKASVPAGPPTPIDGVWRLDANQVRYRIDGSRIYTTESYLHLFVMRLRPGMVVVKDIVRTAPARYEGYDLVLLGKWRATLEPDQSLALEVASKFGPVTMRLTPIQLDNAAWIAQELGLVKEGTPPAGSVTTPGGAPPPPAAPPATGPGAAPSLSAPDSGSPAAAGDCAYVKYDQSTGNLICVR